MTLQSIRYECGELSILDQLLLPHETAYERIGCVEDGWKAIRSMKVRGAPAIAIVGCLSLAVELHKREFPDTPSLSSFIKAQLTHLTTARPTAVNMGKSAAILIKFVDSMVEQNVSHEEIKVIKKIERMLPDDISDNMKLSEHGAKHIMGRIGQDKVTILTHCNTGSLATAGYGTALGVVRFSGEAVLINLNKVSKINITSSPPQEEVYCTETRPYNQGSRLTAYELMHDHVPSTLIADSMVGLVMRTRGISAVVVGADRVTRNGDTANKIGTYQIAVLAQHHGIPFYVAAPITCHDGGRLDGESIVIEERPPHELTCVAGVQLAPKGESGSFGCVVYTPSDMNCWNPAFDVTPNELITGGIITEHGVFTPHQLNDFHDKHDV
uniref:Methylthioribose-1-phosphate isomerase n=1 Tax=Ciona savignyi TaxID=51511 RepID=H2YIR6_CIOSA